MIWPGSCYDWTEGQEKEDLERSLNFVICVLKGFR